MTKITLTAVIPTEGDLYGAEFLEFGTINQGKSLEKAVQNLQEATELYLEELRIAKVYH